MDPRLPDLLQPSLLLLSRMMKDQEPPDLLLDHHVQDPPHPGPECTNRITSESRLLSGSDPFRIVTTLYTLSCIYAATLEPYIGA
jgi:hypothetical protein